jgi:hypothetical protein
VKAIVDVRPYQHPLLFLPARTLEGSHTDADTANKISSLSLYWEKLYEREQSGKMYVCLSDMLRSQRACRYLFEGNIQSTAGRFGFSSDLRDC